jgi:hypothetical protein
MENLPNDWDILQKGLNASILQSKVWADVQEAMGRKPHFEWSNHWSWVGFERKSRGIKYLFVPYGPAASLKGDEALKSVVDFARKQGFDFMTGHLAIQNIGKLKSLNIGDYQAQFGQGLTFWSGFGFGKTADAMNIKVSQITPDPRSHPRKKVKRRLQRRKVMTPLPQEKRND